MSAILRALATAAGLLLPVIVFITLAVMAAVRRGEGDAHPHAAARADASSPVAVATPPRQLSVIEILLFATALFGLAMAALMGISLLGHM